MIKPKECCDCGSYEHCIPMSVNNKVVYIDLCVARLVAALEAGGLQPVASCCGHGKVLPSVLLNDDTCLIVMNREQGNEVIKKYSMGNDL